jgi:hypothetical protein
MNEATLVGHTPDGQPVVIWERDHPWLGQHEVFLEIGSQLSLLDHVAPGLIEALRASLCPLLPTPRPASEPTPGSTAPPTPPPTLPTLPTLPTPPIPLRPTLPAAAGVYSVVMGLVA